MSAIANNKTVKLGFVLLFTMIILTLKIGLNLDSPRGSMIWGFTILLVFAAALLGYGLLQLQAQVGGGGGGCYVSITTILEIDLRRMTQRFSSMLPICVNHVFSK